MMPQELKSSILQLAIQGKLVEQNPDEGSGYVEIEKMLQHKMKLLNAKEIKKEKVLSPVSDDEKPYDIPERWAWVRLGNVGLWSAGATPSRTISEYYGGDIPWLKTGDLNDSFVSEVPERISELALQKTSVRLNPVGSVLMAMYGATIGKLGILEAPMTTNQACCACIPFDGIYNKYLFYFLMGNRQNFIKMGEGGAQPNISKDKIVNYPIAIPPLAEQKRIVAKIEELLPYIDRYEKAWSRLEDFNHRFPVDMRKSILQMAMQGKLVEQRPEEGTGEELYQQIQTEKQKLIKAGKIKKEKPLPEISEDEIPFEIPESWKWCRLSDMAILENGDRSGKYPVDTDYVEFGVPFFGAKDMLGRYMSFENVRYISETKFEELGNGKLKDNDFICLLRGSVGKTAVFKADVEHQTGFICAQMVIVRSLNCELVDYLYHFMTSPYYFEYVESKTTGTAVRQLPAKELSKLLVPLPSLAEQKRIVAKLEEILPLCERLK